MSFRKFTPFNKRPNHRVVVLKSRDPLILNSKKLIKLLKSKMNTMHLHGGVAIPGQKRLVLQTQVVNGDALRLVGLDEPHKIPAQQSNY